MHSTVFITELYGLCLTTLLCLGSDLPEFRLGAATVHGGYRTTPADLTNI